MEFNTPPQILNAQGNPHHNQKTPNTKIFLIFLGVVLLGLGLTFGIGKLQEVPDQTSVLSANGKADPIPSDWRSYTSKKFGFSFAAPPTTGLTDEPSGAIKLEYFGTKQLTRTEFFDGFKITLSLEDLGSKTLKQIIDEKLKREQDAYKEIIKPVTSVYINARNGYTFTSKRDTQTTTLLLTVEGLKQYLSIVYDLEDPEKSGYQKIVDQIISSIQFPQSASLGVSAPQTTGTPSTTVESDTYTVNNTTWKRFTVAELGLEFGVPQKILSLGEVKSKLDVLPTGYTGSQVCVSLILKAGDDPCAVTVFGVGTITKDYNLARNALYIDLQGFEKNEGKYYALLGQQKVELPEKAVKEMTNPNGVSLIKVRGYNDENGSAPGTPGEGWFGGLINTKNAKYPGATVILKIVNDITELDFDQILMSFKYIGEASPSASLTQ